MAETNTNANIQVEEIRHRPLGPGLTALMVTPLDDACAPERERLGAIALAPERATPNPAIAVTARGEWHC